MHGFYDCIFSLIRHTPVIMCNPCQCRRPLVVVIATCIANAILNGATSSTGSLLYDSWQNEFQVNAAMTATIASITSACLLLTGTIGSIICNRYGMRVAMVLGGAITTGSLLASFWANSITQMYVIGAIKGFGLGISLVAGFVAVSAYFTKYYQTANGIANAGFGIGIFVMTPLVQACLDIFGWRGTLLISAAMTANMCVVGALYRPIKHPLLKRTDAPELSQLEETVEMCEMNGAAAQNNVKRKMPLPSCTSRAATFFGVYLFRKSYRFSLFCVVHLLVTISYLCYLIFVIPKALHSGVSPQAASFILSAIGFTSIVGRIASGIIMNWRISADKVYTVAVFFCGVGILLSLSDSYWVMIASGVVLGFSSGAVQATFAVLILQFVGRARLGSGIGLCFSCLGIGNLVITMITGTIYDLTESYLAVFGFLAGLSFVGCALMFFLRILGKIEPGFDDEDRQSTTNI